MADTATVKLIATFQNRMSGGLRQLGRGVRNLGVMFAAAAAAVLVMTKKIADYGAEIFDTSAATNVAIEDIQALGYVFEQTGGSSSSLSGSLRGVNTFMRMAATGAREQTEALETLGLTYENIKDMDPAEIFLLMTDRLGGMTNAMDQNMTAAVLFGGRYSQQVIGALNQTEGSLRGMMTEFEESGRALSTDQVVALKKYSDAMTDLDVEIKKMMADALDPLLPALNGAQEEFIAAATDALPKLMQALVDFVPLALDAITVLADFGIFAADLVDIATHLGGSAGIASDSLNQLANTLETAVKTGLMTGAEAAAILASEIEGATGDALTLQDAIGDTGAEIFLILPLFPFMGKAIASIGEQSVFTSRELEDLLGRINDLRSVTQEFTEVNPFAGLLEQAQPFMEQFSTWVDEQVETGGGDPVGVSLSTAEFVELMTKAEEFAEWEAGFFEDKSRLINKIAREEDSQHDANMDAITAETEAQNLAAQKRHDALTQEGELRTAIMLSARDNAMTFGQSLIDAGLQGEEAAKAWADQVISQLLRIASMKVFGLILSLFGLGSVGDILGKIGGIAGGGKSGGGTIPGAAGGFVVPGSGESDTRLLRVTPGEEVLTSRQREEVAQLRQGGGAGGGVVIENFNYGPMFGDDTPSRVAKSLKALERIQRKG